MSSAGPGIQTTAVAAAQFAHSAPDSLASFYAGFSTRCFRALSPHRSSMDLDAISVMTA